MKNSTTLSSQNKNDIMIALNWLKLNKVLISASMLKLGDDKRYRTRIKFSGKKSDIVDLVKSKFGSFVDVE